MVTTFEVLLVLCVLAITWVSAYIIYRLVTDES